MLKVNKTKARNLFNAGVTIYLLPCKVGLGSMWVNPYKLNTNETLQTFDSFVNHYEYYNCNSELGYYAAYYVEEV